MRNDSLILRGIFSNFIFDTSILNIRITGAGINYSECLENCRQYPFSTRPLQNDFALIQDFLVPKLISQDRYELMVFHADISFDFTKMDFGFQSDLHGRTAYPNDCPLLGNYLDLWSVLLTQYQSETQYQLTQYQSQPKVRSEISIHGKRGS